MDSPALSVDPMNEEKLDTQLSMSLIYSIDAASSTSLMTEVQ